MIETGDVVLLAPALGKESFFQRQIQRMGSVSTHNELIYVGQDGQAFVGCAHSPHFELIPFEDRVAACERGESNMLVARWHKWPRGSETWPDYERWKERVAVQLLLLAELQSPYDWGAIRAIARNWLRDKLHIPARVLKHKEHEVYCTENVEIITRLAGTFWFQSIPPQKFYAPVHVERILCMDDLVVIKDWGLVERFVRIGT